MAGDGTEWDDRFAAILLPGEELDDTEAAPARPVPTAAPATPFPEIDWSKQPTEEERTRTILELGRAGMLSMGQVAERLGLDLDPPNEPASPPLRNIEGVYKVDGSFWDRAQTDYVAVNQTVTELRVGQMPPGTIFDYKVRVSGRVVPAASVDDVDMVPGTEIDLEYRCGGCQNTFDQTLPSWRVGALLSKGSSGARVKKALQRLVDAGCPVCQGRAITRAAQTAQFSPSPRNSRVVETRYRCAFCGVEQMDTFSKVEISEEEARAVMLKIAVCDDCQDRTDPSVYNKYKGLL